jgi:hypothetical protein
MRIWTIQSIAVWEQLQEHGMLRVDEHCDKYNGHIPPAYQWLCGQLQRRLPGYGGHLPWWAYCTKPDLRLYRHTRPYDQAEVRLELEPTPGSMMRFPCWAWHKVFCQDYLAVSRMEYEDWWSRLRQVVPDEDLWPPPEPWRGQVEKTWERLFDSDLPPLSWDEESTWSKEVAVEAAFEVLRSEDVRQATVFRGTAKLSQSKPAAGGTSQSGAMGVGNRGLAREYGV